MRRDQDQPPKALERFLSEQELARLGKTLKDAERTHPMHAAAVLLILLTGCRKSEIIGLRCSALKGRWLRLGDSKTGPRTIWLGAAARVVLDRQPRRLRVAHVFPFAVTCTRSALDPFWFIARRRAGLEDVRLHDLRHSYASHAARLRETLPTIVSLLGHASVGSTSRYAHLDDEQALSAWGQIGCRIAVIMEDGDNSDVSSSIALDAP